MQRTNCFDWDNDDLYLRIYVQTGAAKDEIVGVHGNALKVRITAPPIDGKANMALIKFLGKMFKTPKSNVLLLHGETSREKQFCIKSPASIPEELTKFI